MTQICVICTNTLLLENYNLVIRRISQLPFTALQSALHLLHLLPDHIHVNPLTL